LFQISSTIALTLGIMSPVILVGGLADFYSGFVLRFVGANGAQTKTWNIFAALYGVRFGGAPPFILPRAGAVIGLFLYQSRNGFSLKTTLLWTIIMAAALNVFSHSELQWLSLVISLSLLYG